MRRGNLTVQKDAWRIGLCLLGNVKTRGIRRTVGGRILVIEGELSGVARGIGAASVGGDEVRKSVERG